MDGCTDDRGIETPASFGRLSAPSRGRGHAVAMFEEAQEDGS